MLHVRDSECDTNFIGVKSIVLSPDQSRALVPSLGQTRNPNVWVYRFTSSEHNWTLSVATHAPPGSGKLSLGGFRIVPQERQEIPGFNTDIEAIALAAGMEEKVHWSRVIGIGGPLVMHDIHRIVGGKCVLAPSVGARVGEPNDAELLDFAVAAFREVERVGGILLTTGQDLGHGIMSDGVTQSLEYLNARYKGSVVADTSDLTAHGNYCILQGMLRALETPVSSASVGLIGYGNIGHHIVEKLRKEGSRMFVLEARDDRRDHLNSIGIDAWHPDRKAEFLALPIDALVVNAAGGSLDSSTVSMCAANERLQIICGCENLVMPDESQEVVLRKAGKVYAPTEIGGMMGYLTAAEEYLSRLEGTQLNRSALMTASQRLEEVGYEATARVLSSGIAGQGGGGYSESFSDAVTAIYGDSSI